MQDLKPYVLSIAGFDPSGGACIHAVIKTFEAHKVFGLGVTSCITYQNDSKFQGLDWIDADSIIRQIDMLISKYDIGYVKIGLIENFNILEKVINHLIAYNEDIKIIWDPTLKATAGFDFHNDIDTLFCVFSQ